MDNIVRLNGLAEYMIQDLVDLSNNAIHEEVYGEGLDAQYFAHVVQLAYYDAHEADDD